MKTGLVFWTKVFVVTVAEMGIESGLRTVVMGVVLVTALPGAFDRALVKLEKRLARKQEPELSDMDDAYSVV